MSEAAIMDHPHEAGDREVVIEVRDLVTHYGPREILHSVSLEVYAGETLVIMGGSGSGKTTLLNTLLGLVRPTSGYVRLLGQDLNNIDGVARTKLRQKMGVAFQGGALFTSMNVLQNIMLPLREHTKLDDTTMQIMARLKMEVVNLSGFDDLMPAELSGGMIKRAAFARAIVMDPRVLFCDEPSAGLDPVVASAIDDLIIDYLRTFIRLPDLAVAERWHGIYAKRTDGGDDFIAEPAPGVTIVNGVGGAGMTTSFGLAEEVFAGS